MAHRHSLFLDGDRLFQAQLLLLRPLLDEGKRQEIGYQIQRYLLGVNPDGSGQPLDLSNPAVAAFARLDFATLITASVSWPYYRNNYTWPWFGNNHWTANQWIDRDDPSFDGRQA